MIDKKFIYISIFLAVVGSIFYIYDILKGDTKPNKVSFLLGALVPLSIFFGQKQGSGGIQTIYTLTISACFFLIVIASFLNKKSYWKITKLDICCAALVIISMIMLFLTKTPLLVITLSIAADFLATTPLFSKLYKYPETETFISYGLDTLAAFIVLLTVKDWLFTNYVFAVYSLIISLLLSSLLFFTPHKLKS